MSRVYVLLLNWNGWADTIECLESVFRLDYPDFRVILCDNASTDGSLERIRSWAAGELNVLPPKDPLGTKLLPVAKPVRVDEYSWSTVGSNCHGAAAAPLTLIRNVVNSGFAGGNNVGLNFVLARGDAAYVWLLNNDTVVDPHALRALVGRMESRPTAGICGSSVLKYWHPQRVDAFGGAYYCQWLGLAWHLGRFRRYPGKVNVEKIERRMSYVTGASMLVSMRFLREIGLLEESYFLYYEELDWAVRARGRFSLVYAPESLVYHKIGGTIGTSSHPRDKSMLSDFYTLRNRLKFTRRYHPVALPTVYLGVVAALLVRLLFGQWRKALMVVRLLTGKWNGLENDSGPARMR